MKVVRNNRWVSLIFLALLMPVASQATTTADDPQTQSKEVRVEDVLKRMQKELYGRKGIEAIVGLINKLMPFESSPDNITDRPGLRELWDHIRTNQCDTNPICPAFNYEVGSWSGMLNKTRVHLRRNLVAGSILDGNAGQISLVDTVSVEFQLGYFFGSSKMESLLGSVGANAGVKREWVHVTSLGTAQQVAKDPDFRGFAPIALRTFSKSVEQALAASSAAPVAAGQLPGLEPGEAYMVTDSIGGAIGARLVAPLSEIGLPGASVGLTVSKSHVTLRKNVILRTLDSEDRGARDGIRSDEAQVYLTRARADAMRARVDATYFTRLMSFGIDKSKAQAETLLYRLKLSSPEETRIALRAIRDSLRGDLEALSEFAGKPTLLDHDLRTKRISQKLLFWKRDKVEQNHRVSISLADRTEPVLLQSNRRYRLTSKNWLTPIQDAYDLVREERLDFVTSEDISVPLSEQDEDKDMPSSYSMTTTEAEIASDGSMKDVMTTVEDTFRIKKATQAQLKDIISAITTPISAPQLDAEGVVKARIRSRLMISPEGFANLEMVILPSVTAATDETVLQRLISLWGAERYAKFREQAIAMHRSMRHSGGRPATVFETREGKLVYAPSWMQELIRMRDDTSETTFQSLKRQSKLVELALKNLGATSTIELLGKRGSGYGYALSIEAIGAGGAMDGRRISWNSADGGESLSGPFRRWMKLERISEYELRAKYLNLK